MRFQITFALEPGNSEGEEDGVIPSFVLSPSYGFKDAEHARQGVEAMIRLSDHLELLDDNNDLWPIPVGQIRAFAVRKL